MERAAVRNAAGIPPAIGDIVDRGAARITPSCSGSDVAAADGLVRGIPAVRYGRTRGKAFGGALARIHDLGCLLGHQRQIDLFRLRFVAAYEAETGGIAGALADWRPTPSWSQPTRAPRSSGQSDRPPSASGISNILL